VKDVEIFRMRPERGKKTQRSGIKGLQALTLTRDPPPRTSAPEPGPTKRLHARSNPHIARTKGYSPAL
jgi:hypothetical protein